jgi:preprotein translocase subunit SecB
MEKKSNFQFKGYIITKSNFELKDGDSNELSIEVGASGELIEDEKQFHLTLKVQVKSDDESVSIYVESDATFEYGDIQGEQLNNMLFMNAPAILFPYLRAYITNLTSYSGVRPIILPTLNLQGIKEELENNTLRK